jgi:hypothetical protein
MLGMAGFLLVEATFLFITDVSSVKMITMVRDEVSLSNRGLRRFSCFAQRKRCYCEDPTYSIFFIARIISYSEEVFRSSSLK